MNRLARLALFFPLAAVMIGCTLLKAPVIATTGPVQRQVERVCDRHDDYVQDDLALSEPQREAYLSEADSSRALVRELEEVSGEMLSPVLRPVLARHDAYVLGDADLDGLEKGIALGASEGLRDLLDAAE